MKLAALTFALTTVIGAAASEPAAAFDLRKNQTLGAPLYAGPNTVIVQNGRTVIQNGRTVMQNGRTVVPGYSVPTTRPSSGWQGRIILRNGNEIGHAYGHAYGFRDRDRYAPRRIYIPGYGYVYQRERAQPYGRGNGYGVNVPRYYDRDYYDRDRYDRDRYDRDRYRPRIDILGASYRSIDGRACDAYRNIHRKCDGEASCTVRASNKICGDPDRGRLKVLEITYACNGRQFTARAPEKSNARLSCR